jgi:hypothetical protein
LAESLAGMSAARKVAGSVVKLADLTAEKMAETWAEMSVDLWAEMRDDELAGLSVVSKVACLDGLSAAM